MKTFRYLIEALFAHFLFLIFHLLPARWASGFGGFMLRHIGPHMGASKRAERHMQMALPHLKEQDRRDAVRGMWDNLGRVIAEYPHLKTLARDCVEICGADVLEKAIADDKGAIFVGAHIGNWELYGASVFAQFGEAAHLTYRAPNNPYVERLLHNARTLNGAIGAYPKSRDSGRKLMQALKDGEYLGFLLDQKYNEGVEVPFFGHAAMTNPVAIQLAQKYDCPVIPARCERLDGAQFRITFFPALALKDEEGEYLPVETVLQALHILYEDWITECPDQWLWLHKRWKKEEAF